jgi:hypothetical protein
MTDPTPTITAQIEALAPCPFCGGEAEISLDAGRNTVGVQCKKCPANQTPSWDIASEAWAIRAWNTRPAIVTALKQVEAAPHEWPDIGPDPLKTERPTDRYEASRLAVREAYVKQQPHVPDQTALVWRWHIGTLLEMALRLQMLLKRDEPAQAEAAPGVVEALREAVSKIVRDASEVGKQDKAHSNGMVDASARMLSALEALARQHGAREELFDTPRRKALAELTAMDDEPLPAAPATDAGEGA